ncbi:hypothetical protein E4U41_003123 [Claviceps citrina]|nr:hypothetical protein E4U41_003123 [Claviceps citrina]
MSEDDIDMLGPDGPGSSRVDRDRRPPRFSWTPAYETTFFRSLCASVQLGLRENSSFKAEAWERAAQALQECHGAYPAKSHLINKSDNARKRFRLWRGLREDPDFVYNALSKTVTATEEAWKAHIEREPLSRALRGRPFDHEEYMEILYPDVIGSGGAPKRIMKPRRRTDGLPGDESEMPGAGVLHLQSEPPSLHNGQDSSRPAQPCASLTPTVPGAVAGPQPKPTPTSSTIPPAPRTAPPQQSALTPPDEPAVHAKKRTLPAADDDGAFGATSPPPSTAHPGPALLLTGSPEKRQRTSLVDSSAHPMAASSSHLLSDGTVSESPPSAAPPAIALTQSPFQAPVVEEDPTCDAVRPCTVSRWCEMALEQFFRDFADESMDLQIEIAQHVLVDESKALIYCKMPWRVKQHWIKKLGQAFRKVP